MLSWRRRLIKGVKEQLRINRDEEKQKQMEEKNINDDHRKMLKMAANLTNNNKVSFRSDSPRSSSPSLTDERPLSGTTPGSPTHRRPSNLTRANVKAAAAAAERKAQHPGGRRPSITFGSDSHRGSIVKGKLPASTPKSADVDRLNLEDDDDDDPDMMSLDNSMMSSVGFHSERMRNKQSDQRPTANTSVKTHGKKWWLLRPINAYGGII